MKLDITSLLMQLGISLFCGIIIVSIGIGAALPVIDRVAGPFVCAGKKMELETHTYSYRPGDVTTTIQWNCVDAGSGASKDISFQTTLVSGLIYSLVIFAVLVIRSLTGKPAEESALPFFGSSTTAPGEQSASEGSVKRLAKLKEMRDANLITAQEYEKKKAEILRDL